MTSAKRLKLELADLRYITYLSPLYLIMITILVQRRSCRPFDKVSLSRTVSQAGTT